MEWSNIKTNLRAEYDGPCKVIFETHKKNYYAIFPNYTEAFKAANFAINPQVGGFLTANISESVEPITHKTGEGWLFEEPDYSPCSHIYSHINPLLL